MAAPPRVRLTVAHRVHLHVGQGLPVRVHCDRACDLRAYVPSPGLPRGLGRASLARAGTTVVHVDPNVFESLAPRRGGRIQVAVHACVPGSVHLTTVKARVLATRHAPPPFAVPRGLTARRHGRRIVVRWHTDVPARRTTYAVFGQRHRSFNPDEVVGVERRGRGSRRFRVVLHEPKGLRLRWVSLYAQEEQAPFRSRELLVRIR